MTNIQPCIHTFPHFQYRKVGIPNSVVVPNHNGHDLSIGVIKILEKRQAYLFGGNLFFIYPK